MDLLHELLVAADKVYADKPALKALCMAQGVLESGLLSKPSRLARDYYNLFGIKGVGTIGSVKMPTKEFIKGQWVTVKDSFAYNETVEDSVKQHRQLMEKPRYHKVMAAESFEEACLEVHKAGYATDPAYPDKLMRVFSQILGALNDGI